jgi:hypothetical protein
MGGKAVGQALVSDGLPGRPGQRRCARDPKRMGSQRLRHHPPGDGGDHHAECNADRHNGADVHPAIHPIAGFLRVVSSATQTWRSGLPVSAGNDADHWERTGSLSPEENTHLPTGTYNLLAGQ